MPEFPAHQDVDAVLRDGSTVHVRPVRPEDHEALGAFLSALSASSRLFRFFSPVRDVGWVVERLVNVDYLDTHGLLALRGDPEQIVGHIHCARTGERKAEVALEVADALQGLGVGTMLLGHLASAASIAGIATFEADVMSENNAMLSVFRGSGFPVHSHAGGGVVQVEFPIELGAEALRSFEERDRASARAALLHFFEPRSVAVIGASSTPGSIGREVFHNLLESGFPGPVHPVSPHPVVQSVPAVRDVREIHGEVDLAVVVVPAASVEEVAQACAEKGVKALLVISAGFAEAGLEGRQRQGRLLEICHRSGMRLVGPNCMGIVNTAPGHRLNATFAPAFPPPGRVGFLSQSGALGLAVIDRARQLGLGISSFVSVGNKADISGNDLLEYWEQDPATSVVLLYLESFGNPQRFSRIARRVSRTKPILAVKSGRTPAGARATGSHTGALLAASDVTVDALFRQSGVIRVDTLGELFDTASLLANQVPPPGPRVAILTNAGGPAILCADACVAQGLEVRELAPDTRRQLAEFLPPQASVTNPVDMIATAGAADYARALRILGEAEEVDAIIAIFIPPLVALAEEVAGAIRQGAAAVAGRKPMLAVFMSAQGVPPELGGGTEGARVPSYPYPEDAARALARAAAWARWRVRPAEEDQVLSGVKRIEARSLVKEALAAGAGWLAPAQVARLLDCYGIAQVDWRLVTDPKGAARAARQLGGRVALKAVSDRLLHKTGAGAVALRLPAGRVKAAAEEMGSRLQEAGIQVDGFLVQSMAPAGLEMLVGVVQDPVFGPVVACGAGGTAVEVLKDVSVRLAPLTGTDAREMLRELATFPLLEGYRGGPVADVASLETLLLRVSSLADDIPELAEMDLNPVFATPEGILVADARVRLEAHAPRPPEGARVRRS